MNPLKKLFRFNNPKDISKNEKIGEPTIQEFERLQNENAEREKLTEGTNELIQRFANYEDNFEGFDPLLEDAARLVVQEQFGFYSVISRKMKLGNNRSQKIVNQLALIGIVKPRPGILPKVLIKTNTDLDNFLQNGFYKIYIQDFYNVHKLEIEKKKKENQEQKTQQQVEKEKNLIKQELLENEHRKEIRIEAYKELVSQGLISNQLIDREGRRELIPQDVMDKVWNRDGGRCVKCGSQESLEFDHIIPFSKGGANTYRNLQILCKKCNIEKSNRIG